MASITEDEALEHELHFWVIELGKALGYFKNQTFKGACNGVNLAWIAASIIHQEEKFIERLDAILEGDIDDLVKQIDVAKAKIINRLALDSADEMSFDLLAFYDQLELFTYPNEHREIFHVQRIHQGHLEKIFPLTASQALETKGGLDKVFSDMGIYSQEELVAYLQEMAQFIDEVDYSDGEVIGVNLKSHDHAIGLTYNTQLKSWNFMDINQGKPKVLQSLDKIADKILDGFNIEPERIPRPEFTSIFFEGITFATDEKKEQLGNSLSSLKDNHQITGDLARRSGVVNLLWMAAAWKKDSMLMSTLIKLGAEIEVDSSCSRLVDFVIYDQQEEIFAELAEYGADLTQINTILIALNTGNVNILATFFEHGVYLDNNLSFFNASKYAKLCEQARIKASENLQVICNNLLEKIGAFKQMSTDVDGIKLRAIKHLAFAEIDIKELFDLKSQLELILEVLQAKSAVQDALISQSGFQNKYKLAKSLVSFIKNKDILTSLSLGEYVNDLYAAKKNQLSPLINTTQDLITIFKSLDANEAIILTDMVHDEILRVLQSGTDFLYLLKNLYPSQFLPICQIILAVFPKIAASNSVVELCQIVELISGNIISSSMRIAFLSAMNNHWPDVIKSSNDFEALNEVLSPSEFEQVVFEVIKNVDKFIPYRSTPSVNDIIKKNLDAITHSLCDFSTLYILMSPEIVAQSMNWGKLIKDSSDLYYVLQVISELPLLERQKIYNEIKDEAKIAFDPRYLIDILKTKRADSCVIKLCETIQDDLPKILANSAQDLFQKFPPEKQQKLAPFFPSIQAAAECTQNFKTRVKAMSDIKPAVTHKPGLSN